MMKIILTLFIVLSFSIVGAQPIIEWQKSLGGTNGDFGYSVIQTNDGGYIAAGQARSNNGDVSGNHGNYDYWIIKLDYSGATQWQKCFGGTKDDYAFTIRHTGDGGYIVIGSTASNDFDVAGNHSLLTDFWIVKLDSIGNLLWQECLGGTGTDEGSDIQQTSDGGYVIAGYVNSNNGDVSGNHGSDDYWVAKLDNFGNIKWQLCLGGTAGDYCGFIKQTIDGGFIVAGNSNSTDGDVVGNHGGYDAWIVKLDTAGNVKWKKCYGGSGYDQASQIEQTSDEGYIIAGYTKSNDGDITVNHGGNDFWLIKIDSLGKILWQQCYGGTDDEAASSVKITTDGGYVVCGYTYSVDGDVSGNNGSEDYWVIKLSSTGNHQWQKCLGGTGNELAADIHLTSDGGFILAGMSNSSDGDITGNHGDYDYWMIKLSAAVATEDQNISNEIFIYPNPAIELLNIEYNKKNSGNIKFYKVYDVDGAMVINERVLENKSQIDISNISKGVYFLMIENTKETISGKFLKY